MKLTIERSGKAETLLIEGADQNDILGGNFRNFRGEKRKSPDGRVVNDEGKRNFNLALRLDPEALDDLASLGLNIKELAGNEEYGDEPTRFVKVNVAYGAKRPPELYLCTDKKKKELTQSELGLLDGARFSNVDMIIRTYHSETSANTTLYLQKGFFTIQQDPITAKYENMAIDELGDMIDDDECPFDEN